MMFLDRFALERPAYETAQARSFEWLAAAHTESEARLSTEADFDREHFAARMNKVIPRCSCAPDKIGRRGHVLDDFNHRRWSEMAIYDLESSPHGRGTGARSRFFREYVLDYFRRSYSSITAAPSDLVHVTCTGYVSPSGAQELVQERGWGAETHVTHAYHMGCYAAFPALRIAAGALHAPRALPAATEARVDIVHTELCSLHLDPSRHSPEQLVVQSLFADGLIRYSASRDASGRALAVLALEEAILPGSTDAMQWIASDWGMEMTLSREVPERIAAALRGFVLGLYAQAGLDPAVEIRRSLFAIHPGGPKILDGTREVLELREDQIGNSRDVLFQYGNMSSATLPHVWMQMVEEQAIPSGTLVASLAFGPGLTICGGLFRMQGSR